MNSIGNPHNELTNGVFIEQGPVIAVSKATMSGIPQDDFSGGATFSFDGSKVKDFFKNLFGEGGLIKLSPKEQQAVEEIYKQTGTRKSFQEWITDPNVQLLVGNAAKEGKLALTSYLDKRKLAQEINRQMSDPAAGSDVDYGLPKKGNKILGMHPVTFTLVAVGTTALIATGIVLGVKHFKKKK